MDHDPNTLHTAIDEVLAGHRDAFRHIVREYGLSVRGFIASQLYHLDDVDDLAQDVFLAAFESLGSFRKGDEFGAWLRGIARNKVKMYFRTRMRRENAMERFRSEVGDVVVSDLELASEAVEEQQLARLLSCISKLPDKMRRIVQGGLEGQKAQALAEAMESSVAVIYVTNHRAHKLLRECMARQGV
ncbi:MAG: RNA polymerase factor sigma-70 [Pedosphaera sp.]|nr:MAG: RNA polymerase factor sigma-70 [Pedosphaera sp.]